MQKSLLRDAATLALIAATALGCKPLKKHLLRGHHKGHTVATSLSASVLDEAPPKLVAPEVALERARQLLAAGKADKAIEACASALDKSHFDARVLGMQAQIRAQYQKSEPEYSVLGDFTFAASADGDEHTKAEIWLNRAHYVKAHADIEGWRASLARSLSLEQNPAVAAELGGRSRCLAEVHVPKGEGARVVTGWLGVCRAVGRCETLERVDEATARTRSCLSHPGTAGLDASHGCSDDPPWLSTHDYSMYHWTEDFIVPLPANRYFVYTTGAGEWPAHCDASIDEQRKVVGGLLQITSEVVEHAAPPRFEVDGECWEAQTRVNYEYYSLATGHHLGVVSWLKDADISATFDAKKRRLVLTGGGCDGTVALDGSATFRQQKP